MSTHNDETELESQLKEFLDSLTEEFKHLNASEGFQRTIDDLERMSELESNIGAVQYMINNGQTNFSEPDNDDFPMYLEYDDWQE